MNDQTLLEKMRLDLDKYLADYLEQDFAVYTFDLIEGKAPKIKVRTLSVQSQMAVEAHMKTLDKEEIPLFRMHTYQLHFLSYALLQVGDVVFSSHEETLAYLSNKGSAFIDKISKVQNTFEQLFRTELSSEDLENFSQTPSAGTEPE
jgi:hypothetical protein